MKISFVIVSTLLFFQAPLALAVPHESSSIAIAGPSQIATDAGEKVARQGGNVVDVAVATVLKQEDQVWSQFVIHSRFNGLEWFTT